MLVSVLRPGISLIRWLLFQWLSRGGTQVEGTMGTTRDNPPVSVSTVTWSTLEQGPMTNHAPEQSGNGEAAFGVLVLWMLFILSLPALEASPFCLPLTLTSGLWS